MPLLVRPRDPTVDSCVASIVHRSLRALSLVVLFTAAPSPADACINGTLQATDGWTWETQKAEKALALGEPALAARRVLGLFPKILDGGVPDERAELHDRCRRVLALAFARTDGAAVGATIDRVSALDWAVRALRSRLAAQPDDPARKSDLAEALARTPSGREAAYDLLAELAVADLMPEPRGWAVLGAVAGSLGRAEIARFAAHHCRRLASQSSVCDVPPLAAPPPTLVASQ